MKQYIKPCIKCKTIEGRESILAASINGGEEGSLNFTNETTINDPTQIGAKSRGIIWKDYDE